MLSGGQGGPFGILIKLINVLVLWAQVGQELTHLQAPALRNEPALEVRRMDLQRLRLRCKTGQAALTC